MTITFQGRPVDEVDVINALNKAGVVVPRRTCQKSEKPDRAVVAQGRGPWQHRRGPRPAKPTEERT